MINAIPGDLVLLITTKYGKSDYNPVFIPTDDNKKFSAQDIGIISSIKKTKHTLIDHSIEVEWFNNTNNVYKYDDLYRLSKIELKKERIYNSKKYLNQIKRTILRLRDNMLVKNNSIHSKYRINIGDKALFTNSILSNTKSYPLFNIHNNDKISYKDLKVIDIIGDPYDEKVILRVEDSIKKTVEISRYFLSKIGGHTVNSILYVDRPKEKKIYNIFAL